MEKQTTNQRHILFELTPLDGIVEDIEEKTRRSYQNVKQMIADKSAKECQEIYLRHLAINPQANLEELTMGLLVAILLEPDKASDYYRDIVTFSKDNLALFGSYLNMIIIERMSKISDSTLKQIFWIANQLMKAGCSIAENTCSNLIRQTAGGDLSARNLLMVENLIDLLTSNRSWLINSTSFMGPTVIYNFMRLISDHMAPSQTTLRQREIDFVIGLIKEKFEFVQHIGKDFLRLLHNLIKIPEFEKLHQDIYNNPKALHPKYEGPQQLLAIRSPRRLFQSRLTFDMERKISFLATHVKFGSQKRYQDWFHRQYLSTPESLSLRCDLIRYICTIIHPSNEVLCSDIIPRWAIIGWLLTTCTTSVSAANSKQALFFDWFAFDSKTDNIMNIEPAILVMYYSLRSHPNVTASLLDYLCRIPSSFSQKLSDSIKAGIKKSLQQILEKRVIQSLAPLFDNPKHDPGLRALIRENFPEFCANPGLADNGVVSMPTQIQGPLVGTTEFNNSMPKQPDVILIEEKTALDAEITSNSSSEIRKINHDSNHVARNSDLLQSKQEDLPKQKSSIVSTCIDLEDPADADSTPKQSHDNNRNKKMLDTNDGLLNDIKKISKVTGIQTDILLNFVRDKERLNQMKKDHSLLAEISNAHVIEDSTTADNGPDTKVIYPFMAVKRVVPKDTIKSFDESISGVLEDLSVEKSNETRCSLMDKLISAIFDLNEQSINQGVLDDLGSCVAQLLVDDFTTRIFPSSSQDNESLEESIATPLFVLCRSAFTSSKVNPKPLSLLAAIAKVFEATGFLVLYFLRVNFVVNSVSFAPNYITFCEATKRKTTRCLYDDLQMALTYDSEMFCFMLPSIFGEIASNGTFPVTNNSDLIHLVVSAIDPNNLQELICLCLTGSAKVINRENPLPVIESSLNWESWEQYCLWKLIAAQTVPVENYISILPKLSAKANPEAMSCIVLNLQKVSEPDAGLVQNVIDSISKHNEHFVTAVLRYWSIKTDIKELTKNITSLFDSPPASPQMKRKGQAKTVAKSVSSLSSRSEKILKCLDSVRLKAPRNKLLAQAELLEMLPQMEALCSDSQKKKFADLFSIRPKATKKKKMDKDATT